MLIFVGAGAGCAKDVTVDVPSGYVGEDVYVLSPRQMKVWGARHDSLREAQSTRRA